MTEVTRHTEISTAAELRRKAAAEEREASWYRFYGRQVHADRLAAYAQELRAMAALVECAPFGSENRGPAMLARLVRDRIWPEVAAERQRVQDAAARWIVS